MTPPLFVKEKALFLKSSTPLRIAIMALFRRFHCTVTVRAKNSRNIVNVHNRFFVDFYRKWFYVSWAIFIITAK
jgi:hypothetical protein